MGIIIFSHWVNLKTSIPIPRPVDRDDDIVPLSLVNLKTSIPIPCPVDRDDIVPLSTVAQFENYSPKSSLSCGPSLVQLLNMAS